MQIMPSFKSRETIEYDEIRASMRISCRIAVGRQTEWIAYISTYTGLSLQMHYGL